MDGFDDDRFSPLTENELAAVPAVDDAAEAQGECIMPVPANAPPMPSEHPKLGKPSDRWPYRDADGALFFEVWRFDPSGERKQFLPLSLWSTDGRLAWHWKALPAPRPLYGLDKLTASPDAPIVICEGEKAADAAAWIFPKSICITSPGGARAASKADWKPLAGQHVLIWPDADEPGAKYAVDAARILHGHDCDVSIIDAVVLASTSP